MNHTSLEFLQPLYAFLASLPIPALQAKFMQRAVIELLLLAPLCAIMGTLTVQFRMAFFSDAVAHSAFTGIALGLMLGIDPWLTLLLFGVFIGILTVKVRRQAEMSMDTTLGVLFSSTIALGLVLISAHKGLGRNLPAYLYGDILAVRDSDVLATFVLLFFSGLFLWQYFNQLLAIGLHEDLARAEGIAAPVLETVFAGLLALVVAFAIRAVGILLVTALLIIPAAAANNLARSVAGSVWLAILFGLASCFGGLAISVWLDLATGGSMILWASVLFLATVPLKTRDRG